MGILPWELVEMYPGNSDRDWKMDAVIYEFTTDFKISRSANGVFQFGEVVVNTYGEE